jgi:hypothetical protein
MRSYDYFHSDDPVEAAKFVVSDAVAVLTRMTIPQARSETWHERWSSSSGNRGTAA